MTEPLTHNAAGDEVVQFVLDAITRWANEVGVARPKKNGAGWRSPCPFCVVGELTVSAALDGVAPVCAAGCERREVLKSLHLSEADVLAVMPRWKAARRERYASKEEASKSASRAGTTGAGPLRIETWAEFCDRADAEPEPTYLIEPLGIPDAGRVLIQAAPKSGKTFLAKVVAKSAAMNGRPVYLVLCEGRAKALAARGRNLGIPRDAPLHIVHQQRVRLDDATVVEQLRGLLAAQGPPPVLVLDPWGKIFGGRINDPEAMGIAIETVDALGRANAGALIVILHHTGKAFERGEGGPNVYGGRGATELAADADLILTLKRLKSEPGSGQVRFSAAMDSRDGESDCAVEVTIDLGAGEVTFAEATEAAKEGGARQDDVEKKVLALLATVRTLSKTNIAKRVRARRQDVFTVVDHLVEIGKVMNAGTNSKPLYALKTEPANGGAHVAA